ncbi:hypothetical protein [Oscillibacter sp.]|uniref:type II secretion system F family protein n=1 Tax=Oscillibacter sp. TaxID=1945593 RepID=UPI003399B54A
MDARNTLVLILIITGGLLLTNARLPHFSIRGKAKELAAQVEAASQKKKKHKETAREYVERIDGHPHENFARKSYREAKTVYDTIGQSDRYQRALRISLFTGALGAVAGLLLRNLPLAVVLAVGLYFLPLWLSQFTLFRYQRFVSQELETSLSLITTSYNRNNDILAAIEENLNAISEPVRTVFTAFCNGLRYVDANAPAAIERMKGQLDNPQFHEWCDILILCQDNHLLQAALQPVVNKFAILKAQQDANETRMMLPMKYAIGMASLLTGFCPLLRILNQDWYGNLMHTVFGQMSLAFAAITVFVSLNKAISLSRPISYDV